MVGAGFAGLYGVHRFRTDGLSVRGFERGSGVGGTWFWNRYPGARCDIESIYYSYSFSEELQQEWTWTHRYATQPEILAYLNHVADRFDLRKAFAFDTSVTSAVFDDESQTWTVTADNGEIVRCRFVVMATGPLSTPVDPQIPGLTEFGGQVVRTSDWLDEIDLTGKRVGIVGTGSSCIQSAPIIADEAEHLHVFQRTPQFSIPAWNRPYDEDEIARIKAGYPRMRQDAWDTVGGIIYEQADHDPLTATPEQRQAWLERTWARGGYLMIASYPNVVFNDEVNSMVGEFVKEKIRARIHDERVADQLTPTYPFAAKRLCVDTDYFEIYNREDVTLVDLREHGISHADTGGIVLKDSSRIDLDVIVLATGFHALTGAILGIDLRGRGGVTIQEKWSGSAANHLGLTVAGFPNFFMVSGPGSIGVLYNMIPAAEQHIDFIADAIAYLDSHGLTSIEPTEEAEKAWSAHVNEVAEQSVYPKANTWYMGDNVPGKPREFLAYAGGGPAYFEHFTKEQAEGYPSFVLRERSSR
ncbi:NAD(P)/FAD-dependent oxidoreductase [Pseudonocardia yuanmonensis]|uniref:NAD(P)/FAD-dependent oxidoreductase n=1 Tax=Pseudonocardia yuanmonensis TaxID=1095914 RepID=A0ABP8XLB4_9PSEU